MPVYSSFFAQRSAVLLVFLLGILSAQAQETPLHLGDVFHDHAVVQRNAPISVWGTAAPGETVTVEFAEVSEVEADDEGHWSTVLPALPAGGPYTLTVRASSGAVQTAEDILVGDVFLCSGQSNMVFPVSRAIYGAMEAQRMEDDRVRMLTVPLRSSSSPLDAFADSVAWEVASPETVPDWSAACAFFARDLRAGPLADGDVPVGLITAAWGGSGIRAWTSTDALAALGDYDDGIELLQRYVTDEVAAQQTFGASWENWWRTQTGDAEGAEPWQPSAGTAWAMAPDGLGDWTQWDDLRDFTGMVWFRTTINLSAEQANQAASLALGAIDEVDQTWVNGRVVANTFGYGTERTYDLPAAYFREGENVVVVNVLNTYGAGGLTGEHGLRALRLADGTRIPLDAWQYAPVPRDVGYPPQTPWGSVSGLSTIHNAMVAPLRDYGLRAALWYQGESDTGRGCAAYASLLSTLIGQWRDQFAGGPSGSDLPVLVVQLPNFGPRPTEPGPSGWAEIREAQRLVTRADPHAALAVTIDVGDYRDLHPINKQGVGARLARAARHLIYGEPVTPSGPFPAHAEQQGDIVTVTFDDVEDALVAYSGAGPIGFEVCGTASETCRYADARIDGAEIHVRVEDDGPVSSVRYAWADSPIVTLYDGSGLPVGPFEIPVGRVDK